MKPKNARLAHAIWYKALVREMGVPEKLDLDFQGTFVDVKVYRRNWTELPPDEHGRRRYEMVMDESNHMGTFTVKIRSSASFVRDGRRVKVSKHRVFVVCDCGREIPFGRMHMHVCKPAPTLKEV